MRFNWLPLSVGCDKLMHEGLHGALQGETSGIPRRTIKFQICIISVMHLASIKLSMKYNNGADTVYFAELGEGAFFPFIVSSNVPLAFLITWRIKIYPELLHVYI